MTYVTQLSLHWFPSLLLQQPVASLFWYLRTDSLESRWCCLNPFCSDDNLSRWDLGLSSEFALAWFYMPNLCIVDLESLVPETHTWQCVWTLSCSVHQHDCHSELPRLLLSWMWWSVQTSQTISKQSEAPPSGAIDNIVNYNTFSDFCANQLNYQWKLMGKKQLITDSLIPVCVVLTSLWSIGLDPCHFRLPVTTSWLMLFHVK